MYQCTKIGSFPIYQPTYISQYRYIEKETRGKSHSALLEVKILYNENFKTFIKDAEEDG